jgi:hypothetical protein
MLGGASSKAMLLGRPRITQPLAVQFSPGTSSQWLRAANAMRNGSPTVRFFTFRNKKLTRTPPETI